MTSLSEIENTLQELASTTSTPSKSDVTADTTFSSPYSTPTHNNLNTSRSSPYASYQSSSNRTNTPLPNQAKPPIQRTQSESKASPKVAAPTPAAKKPASVSKIVTTPPSVNHSFVSSFDPSSPTSPTAVIAPDSPKIRSKHSHSVIRDEQVEIPPPLPPQDITQEEEGLLLTLSLVLLFLHN